MTPESSLATRVTRRLPELLAGLATRAVAAAVLPVAEAAVRAFVQRLHDGPVSATDVSAFGEIAVRQAEEGTPLPALLAACSAALDVVWSAVLDESTADVVVLRRQTGALLRQLDEITAVIAEAYFEERHAIRAEDRDARRALATALISGEHAEGPAAHLGVRVAPAYVALALQLEPPADGDPAPGDGAVAARRRLRRVQEQLDAFADEPVLSLLDPTSGIALLPATPDAVHDVLDRLPGLLTDISTATGTAVIGGAAGCVGLIAVSRTAAQARDVLAIARRLGRPPGVYVLDDVLLEYQLTRDSDARPLLAGLLDAIEDNADLMQTLECYLANDLDRRGTATALHVHPNTLDYRLRRIGQLTGLDPGKPSGQQLLTAALTARRLV
ncbi:MAG: PucR family transcriptional regulator [Actinomycetes bacterium]